ncbi:hypothetical protein [Sphingobacterium faecium]|uniref:hypothetical protein n=1 Tax=Sphingobacterium faecium TaxID=34087 RepID=UPI003209D858
MTKKEESSTELNKNICNFIKMKYFDPFKIDGVKASQNKYAKACDLSSSTISKIINQNGYDIPLSTIHVITKFQKTNLDEFFTDFLIQFPQHRADL